MREKSSGASSLLWRIMMGVVLLVGAQAFAPHIQAQGRGQVARARNHRRAAAPQRNFRPGEVVNLTGSCMGKIVYKDSKPGAVEQEYENATINFNGASFSIDGVDPSLASGRLSVITRSRNPRHLSLAVNLTFNPPANSPVFTLSLRGCYNRYDEVCSEPARGQGTIDNKLRLKTVSGDRRFFSFESASCSSEPQISRP